MTRIDASGTVAGAGNALGSGAIAQLDKLSGQQNYDQALQAVQGRAPGGGIVKGILLQRTYGTGYVSYFFKGSGHSHALPTTLTSRADALAHVRAQISKGTYADLMPGDPRDFDRTQIAAAGSKSRYLQPISASSVVRALMGVGPDFTARSVSESIVTASHVFGQSPLAQRYPRQSMVSRDAGDSAVVLRNTYEDGWDFRQAVQGIAASMSLWQVQPQRLAAVLKLSGIDATSTEFMRGLAAATADAKGKEPPAFASFMINLSTAVGLIGGMRPGAVRANGTAVPRPTRDISMPGRVTSAIAPAASVPVVRKGTTTTTTGVTVPVGQTIAGQQNIAGKSRVEPKFGANNALNPSSVPTDRSRAIVVRHPAAVSYDIPAPSSGKGESRVASVYGFGGQDKGVSEPLATLIARTLQDVNPASYGKQSTATVVRDAVRQDEKTSLIVVVRSKNISGRSPQADSVGTAETWATPTEQLAIMKSRGADFTQAVAKIRLGTAKIFESPPATAAGHAAIMKSRAGKGYGYIGQVIGDNLKGSGGQAMEGAMKLAQAANMKGVTLYTNAASGFYEKLGFKVQGRSMNANGSTSTHMVWDNPNYQAGQPTLKLNNPAVTNTLKGGGPPLTATPQNPRRELAPQRDSSRPGNLKPGSVTATEGTARATGATPFSELRATALPYSKEGLVTRVELAKGSVQGAVQSFYNRGTAVYNEKIEGPLLRLAGRTAQGVNNRVLLPSARVLNDKVLTPLLNTADGQRLLELANSGKATIKTAAFEAKLATVMAADSTAGRILRDLGQIAKSAAVQGTTNTFNALGAAGKGLQKAMPAVAASTAVILTNAAVNGTLRMGTIAPGGAPTGEALAAKKALNIPNGLGFTYMMADVPGMEKVGGRAIFAFGGGSSAVIIPATAAGQSGVSQPWLGKRADGSLMFAATGAAYGPNAFVGYNVGTPNLNISDVYTSQLGRASTNPISTSAGGVRASGRGADLKLGVVAADLATSSNVRVLNVGPAALTFTRFRDPLGLKGSVVSSESKYLVLLPKTNPQGQLYYVPFVDPTLKSKISQIEPIVPITGSTTWDPKAKDMAELGIVVEHIMNALPKNAPGGQAPTPKRVDTPLLPAKRPSDPTTPPQRTESGAQPRLGN
ncbi:MAG: hypothetical protein LH480_06005 [Rubrivivax sp.]|nr:hypothetical protein [Rubrivivax sp.]